MDHQQRPGLPRPHGGFRVHRRRHLPDPALRPVADGVPYRLPQGRRQHPVLRLDHVFQPREGAVRGDGGHVRVPRRGQQRARAAHGVAEQAHPLHAGLLPDPPQPGQHVFLLVVPVGAVSTAAQAHGAEVEQQQVEPRAVERPQERQELGACVVVAVAEHQPPPRGLRRRDVPRGQGLLAAPDAERPVRQPQQPRGHGGGKPGRVQHSPRHGRARVVKGPARGTKAGRVRGQGGSGGIGSHRRELTRGRGPVKLPAPGGSTPGSCPQVPPPSLRVVRADHAALPPAAGREMEADTIVAPFRALPEPQPAARNQLIPEHRVAQAGGFDLARRPGQGWHSQPSQLPGSVGRGQRL